MKLICFFETYMNNEFFNQFLMETVILSLGGSIVAPDGIAIDYIEQFVKLISKHKNKRFIVVVGGGKPARMYQSAAKQFHANNTDLDWIGVRATQLNAELLRAAFGKEAHSEVINDPSKKLTTKKRVIIASGWKPGWSTDYDAILFAKQTKTKFVINMSNIDCVYDKDPNKFIAAKQYSTMSWNELLKLTGTKWDPGANAPFDPIAAKEAKKIKIEVVVCNGRNLENVDAIIQRKSFVGTTIRD